MKLFAFALLALVAAPLIAWTIGVRVFVIQPIGAIPEGVTVVVYNVPGLNFVDSPDAICQRTQGGVSLLCRGAIAASVAKRATILVRLPFSGTLYWLSGAPTLTQ